MMFSSFLLLAIGVTFSQGKTETCSKKIDLAIILDASASIGEDNFNLAKNFAKTLSRRFTTSSKNVRVAFVAYSQHINVLSRFSDDQDKGKLENIISNAFYEASSSGTGKTMEAVNFEVFSAKSGSRIGRPGVKKATVVVTDGYSGLGTEFVKMQADRMKTRGIEMFAIGITKRMNEEELTALSSKPVKSHLFRLTDLKAVKGIVDHIVKEVCK
ncbi:hypothetical protein ACROYT_G044016 [Oculina patagonica]